MAENLPEAHALHLAADRTSYTKATASQFRPSIHIAAYRRLHTLEGLSATTPFWRDAQFDTVCLAFSRSPPASPSWSPARGLAAVALSQRARPRPPCPGTAALIRRAIGP